MNGVYDIFDHWYHGGTIYFYSDPHFGDEEIYRIRINRRKDLKHLSLQEFDTFQIKSINKRVGKNDTIVFLGDIGDIECIKRIRGYKVLIKGNHDVGCTKYKREVEEVTVFSSEDMTADEGKGLRDALLTGGIGSKQFQDASDDIWSKYSKKEIRDNKLFDEVYGGRLLISEKIVLSHAPYDDPYALNIHGHDHSGNSFNDPMHWNMCAENIDYTPVSIKEVINSGRLKNVPDLLRDAIDKQIEDKKRRSHGRDESK